MNRVPFAFFALALPVALILVPEELSAQGVVSGNAFNPSISLILDGKYSYYSDDPDDLVLPGFLADEEIGPPEEGLSLGESELVMSANIDDQFYGFFTAALEDEDGDTEIELEEAWIQTLALPYGLGIKAGKFYSDIGYHNVKHPHTWDFVDAPLAYSVFLGGNYGDTGAQLRWVAPTTQFIELGGEVLRGDSFPANGAANDGAGAFTLFARTGGDIGVSQSWRFGLSLLSADAEERDSGEGDVTFDGDSDLYMVDFVWKWAENGNSKLRNLVVAAEYMHREEDGDVAIEDSGDAEYDGDQDGLYAQAVYQFRPKWRVGVRYDYLTSSNDVDGFAEPTLLDDGDDPYRFSTMLDFSHSEFSRLRLQASYLDTGATDDTQIFMQYIMSLGAHGAHKF
ncbi:MAG: porin [Chromatiales bacterium]|nr:porin [Chromatiales bacterium]MDH3931745.1 porin [Chromatiales bacterium]MDH3946862.1 porin [Chromatiales bacterium]MDH4014547.1 porin [Chromatiales bacterium]